MATNERERYLSDLYGRVDPEHGRVIPDWLMREASAEDDWEKKAKEDLEISSFAREFQNKFVDAVEVKNRQSVAAWKPEEAAEWLLKKTKEDDGFNQAKAKRIMLEAGLTDEKVTEVFGHMGEPTPAREEELYGGEKGDSGQPSDALKKVEVPEKVQQLEVEKGKDVKKTKKAGSYGLVLTDESCILYKQGNKIAELAVEACGGMEVLADEMDAISTEKEAELLFGVTPEEDAAKVGWFLPKKADTSPSVVYDDKTNQRINDNVGDLGEFREEHVNEQRPVAKTPAPAAGSTSLTPGANADNAPTIPGAQ